MHQISTIREGLESLFRAGDRESVDFTYEKASREDLCDHVLFQGESIPLLTVRYRPRNYAIFTTIPTLGELSTLKTLDFAPCTRTLRQELFRELDLAEFFLGSRVRSIKGYGNEQAANFIIRMENETLCSLEMSVTMPAEARREVKHTVFTTNGMVTDMIADNVIIHDLVHLYNDSRTPVGYIDHDINLYGLSLEEQNICYAIYAILDGRENKDEWKRQAAHLETLVGGAVEALRTGTRFEPAADAP